MTKISATIFNNAEAWLLRNMPDMEVDWVSSMRRIHYDAKTGAATYKDLEKDEEIWVPMSAHVQGLEKLVKLVNEEKLFVGGISTPIELLNLTNWDAEVVDAFWQLVCYGEVIYG